jgi:cold shock CspA family protein
MQMNGKEQRIHISEIDEFLARSLAAGQMKPFRLGLSKNGDQGYLKAVIAENDELIEDDGVDFELSSGENKDLDDFEISGFVMKTVYTSSAYELFDYIFAYFRSIECVINFKENAWLVKVVKTN